MRADIDRIGDREAGGGLIKAGVGDPFGQLALDHQPAQAVLVGIVIARVERGDPARGDMGEDAVRRADLTRHEGDIHVEPGAERLDHVADLLTGARRVGLRGGSGNRRKH